MLFIVLFSGATASGAITTPVEPLAFEENDGQHDETVRFVGRANSYSVLLESRGATIAVPVSRADGKTETGTSRLTFVGATGPSAIEPLDRVAGVSNFFRDSSTIINVPSYGRVAYRDLYPGIDAVLHASPTNDVEIDFIVAPGAVPEAITLDIKGPWTLAPSGDLQICVADAVVVLRHPVAYQIVEGIHRTIPAAYSVLSGRGVQFELGPYDRRSPVIIDPEVSYATAIAQIRTINDIAVDHRENAFVVGSTVHSTFTTTPGAYQPTYKNAEDAVLIKYDKAGQRIFATFLGGTDSIDRAIGIAVDDEEQMYVTGWTVPGYDSTLGITRFPVTPAAYQAYPYTMWVGPGFVSDVFVTKFNSSGGSLLFSSLVGGSGSEEPAGIALGPAPQRNVYVTGWVNGPPNDPQYKQFPTIDGAYRRSFRGDPTAAFNYDGFVFALANDGSALVASTLFGGLKGDYAHGLAVDSAGDVWVAGATASFDFPRTVNAYRRNWIGPAVDCGPGCTFVLMDAFVLKFNAAMTQLLYGTFLPGSSPHNHDEAHDITVDSENNAYVVGSTPSDDFPTTPGVYQNALHGGFLTKFNAMGQVQFSTVLGGGSSTSINGVRTSGDVVFIVGTTNVTDFPTKGSIQAQNGGGVDMFICALNGSGNVLEFSTYLGGTSGESVWSLDVDAASNLYMVGSTGSPNFPYTGNAAEAPASGSNTFYLKISADRDGDGLLDWWELSGIDSNGDGTIDLDLAALGANVNHKDLFVEIDYMTAALHDHDPRTLPSGTPMATSGIAPVVVAFANASVSNPDGQSGVTLHAFIDESIPEQTPISMQGPNSDFNRIKLGVPPSPCGSAHFGTVADRSSVTNCSNIIKAKRRVYRYALFAHNYSEHIGSSGRGENPGNDLVVSLNAHEPNISDFEDFAAEAAAAFDTTLETEWRDLIAGTFMHELGHTLGLHHGGGFGLLVSSSRDEQCKPNYLSVMNYARQFNFAAPAPGTTSPPIRTNRTLDYSRSALAGLAESALVEGNGISGPTGVSILYGEGTSGTARVAPASGAIDWDGRNGIDVNPVSADVNQINIVGGCTAATFGDFLFGHDDWSHLVYNFRLSPDYADGSSISSDTPEPDEDDISGGLLGTQPPLVTLVAPLPEARFNLGAPITIDAPTTDADGFITSVAVMDGETVLSIHTAAPYSYNWTNAGQGTHIVRAFATDDRGAATAKQVTIHVGCTASFAPTSASAAFDALSGIVELSIASGCGWATTTDAPWLSVTPTTGNGATQLTYAMTENTVTSSRSATITVAGQTFVVTQDAAPPFGAPTGVIASGTGVGAPTIAVSWHGTSGVSGYEVAFASDGTTYTTAGSTTVPFFDITTGVASGAAYLVKVRAVNFSETTSAYSTPDLASTFIYTDDPPQTGVTGVKTAHWTELRTAVNVLRELGGLDAATWTANIAPGQVITTTGVNELRTALDEARTALAIPVLTYADHPLTAGTAIRTVHIAQLRLGTR